MFMDVDTKIEMPRQVVKLKTPFKTEYQHLAACKSRAFENNLTFRTNWTIFANKNTKLRINLIVTEDKRSK